MVMELLGAKKCQVEASVLSLAHSLPADYFGNAPGFRIHRQRTVVPIGKGTRNESLKGPAPEGCPRASRRHDSVRPTWSYEPLTIRLITADCRARQHAHGFLWYLVVIITWAIISN